MGETYPPPWRPKAAWRRGRPEARSASWSRPCGAAPAGRGAPGREAEQPAPRRQQQQHQELGLRPWQPVAPRKEAKPFLRQPCVHGPRTLPGAALHRPRGGCVEPRRRPVHHANWIPPLQGTRFLGAAECVRTGQYHMPKRLSREITDLIQRMLTLNPSIRATLDDVWQYPWVNMGHGPGGATPASL